MWHVRNVHADCVLYLLTHTHIHVRTHTLSSRVCSHIIKACNVENADNYTSGCEVSSCVTGWTVIEDKSECVANKCSCVNGVESTGAKCVRDGIESCESCDAGFRLNSANKTCAGMFIRLSMLHVRNVQVSFLIINFVTALCLRCRKGEWVRGEPAGCASKCGVGEGESGTPGAVNCTASSCDADTKPAAKACPRTADCGMWPLLTWCNGYWQCIYVDC